MNRTETVLIKPLPLGYNLVKRPGENPCFEIWQGTGSMRDLVHRFDDINDAVHFLVVSGYCHNFIEATQLLNKGGADA